MQRPHTDYALDEILALHQSALQLS
jgi:hypothetical protein